MYSKFYYGIVIMHSNLSSQLLELEQKIVRLEQERLEHEYTVQALTQYIDVQKALYHIMEISTAKESLYPILEKVLGVILGIPWLALEKKGAIFIAQSNNSLEMVVHHNLNESLLKMCSTVPFGTCICGQTALTKQLIFKSCIDNEHLNKPEGMEPHGHYSVPILDPQSNLLGVLNFYVQNGHISTSIETLFLKSVSKIIASLIERKILEKSLQEAAFLDPLTGLANRRYLMNDLTKAISQASRNKTKFAVLFLDLDKFKPINDNLGHEAGDKVLQLFSERLRKIARHNDSVARIGGDEFVLLADNISSEDNIISIINRLKDEMSTPFHIDSNQVSITASIGYAIYPDHGSDPDTLIKLADKAMYNTKSIL